MKKVLIIMIGGLLLVACDSKKETTSMTEKTSGMASTHESIASPSSEASKTTATGISETSEEELIQNTEKEKLNEYNSLPTELQVYLAATTVDERAMTPNLEGFNIFYHFENDKLILRVHSGVGRFHPYFIFGYDDEFLYPQEQLCYNDNGNMNEGLRDFDLDTTPISKIDLLEKYKASQNSFDTGVKNLVEDPEMTLASLEDMKNPSNN